MTDPISLLPATAAHAAGAASARPGATTGPASARPGAAAGGADSFAQALDQAGQPPRPGPTETMAGVTSGSGGPDGRNGPNATDDGADPGDDSAGPAAGTGELAPALGTLLAELQAAATAGAHRGAATVPADDAADPAPAAARRARAARGPAAGDGLPKDADVPTGASGRPGHASTALDALTDGRHGSATAVKSDAGAAAAGLAAGTDASPVAAAPTGAGVDAAADAASDATRAPADIAAIAAAGDPAARDGTAGPAAAAESMPMPMPAPAAALAPPAPAPAAVPAAAQAQLSAPPGSAAFAAQFGTAVTTFVQAGIEQARLNLHPAELGPVSVQIQLDGSAAQVHLAADHALTRQALQDAMPLLAAGLREAGLTLAGGGVFEQAAQARQEADRQAAQSRAGQRTAGGAPAGDDAPAAAVAPRRRGVVDLVA